MVQVKRAQRPVASFFRTARPVRDHGPFVELSNGIINSGNARSHISVRCRTDLWKENYA